MPKRGDRVTAYIESLSPEGDGRGFDDGGQLEILIPGTVPGDRVEATIRRKRRDRLEARTDRFLDTAMPRQAPVCPHFGTCGGCRWQDLAYQDQLRLKQLMVANAFAEYDVTVPTPRPIVPAVSPFYYRNKMEFSFGRDGEGDLQLGLHVRGRYNRVFDLQDCRLQSQLSNRIVDSVRKHATANKIPVYDLKTHQGVLRFLVVRDGKNTNQLMVNLVVSAYPHDGVEDLAGAVLEDLPEITTFVVTVHSGKAQVAKGEREICLKGSGRIAEVCGGIEYEISPQSFFQTNTLQAQRLYEVIIAEAGDLAESSVLDLYCGTGGISLRLAREARDVVGVEQTPEAVENARRNATKNGIDNCTFVVDQVENAVGSMLAAGRRFDIIIVDPPRPGIHKSALAVIDKLAPAILIYVSCNPRSLAADTHALCTSGFRLTAIQPLDLFPQTHHCEVVARVERV